MSSKYVFIKNRGEEYFKVMKKVKGIYYLVEEGHYGLKMILEFEDTEYLYFDSCKFQIKKNETLNLITSKWTKLEYPESEKDDVYIKEIKERTHSKKIRGDPVNIWDARHRRNNVHALKTVTVYVLKKLFMYFL